MAAYRRTHGPSPLAWTEGWQPTGAKPHSSDEPSELSKLLSHDHSTLNIVLSIIIIIIFLKMMKTRRNLSKKLYKNYF